MRSAVARHVAHQSEGMNSLHIGYGISSPLAVSEGMNMQLIDPILAVLSINTTMISINIAILIAWYRSLS